MFELFVHISMDLKKNTVMEFHPRSINFKEREKFRTLTFPNIITSLMIMRMMTVTTMMMMMMMMMMVMIGMAMMIGRERKRRRRRRRKETVDYGEFLIDSHFTTVTN